MDNIQIDKELDFLIKDENEAVDGYDKVIKELNSQLEGIDREQAVSKLTHIKDEELEHIRELNELKAFLLPKPTSVQNELKVDCFDCAKPVLHKNKKEDSALDLMEESVKKLYKYEGPIRRFGKVVDSNWEGETRASSPKQALNNFRFKAGKSLGLDVGSHKVKVELDPRCMYEVDEENPYNLEDYGKCPNCGALLNETGTCPVCDDGEKDY